MNNDTRAKMRKACDRAWLLGMGYTLGAAFEAQRLSWVFFAMMIVGLGDLIFRPRASADSN